MLIYFSLYIYKLLCQECIENEFRGTWFLLLLCEYDIDTIPPPRNLQWKLTDGFVSSDKYVRCRTPRGEEEMHERCRKGRNTTRVAYS